MKKQDFIILGAALIIAALIYAVMRIYSGAPITDTDSGEVIVYVSDSEYARGKIGEDQLIRVEQADGSVNEIVIDSYSVYMKASTCHNQNCVEQGRLELGNVEGLALRNWIICLPNRVSVELKVK